MTTPSLFIGIPCYQERPILRQTVDFLKSRTATPHQLEVNIAKQSVVKNKNALLAKAKASGAEYICLCDDDIEPPSGWDVKLIDAMKEYTEKCGKQVGQTSPQIIYPDGNVFCAWINMDLNVRDPNASVDVAQNANGMTPEIYQSTGLVGGVAGTLTIFHRDFLNSVEWHFDDRYERSQFEDNDQSLSCRDLGFQVLYVGECAVRHFVSPTRNPRARSENLQKLFDKWHGREDLNWPPERPSLLAQFSLEYVAAIERYRRLRIRLEETRQSVSWWITAPARRLADSARDIMARMKRGPS